MSYYCVIQRYNQYVACEAAQEHGVEFTDELRWAGKIAFDKAKSL